jgi:Family of unknown function (DUF6452)
MKKIAALLLVALSFSSCEKDDICSAETDTTPQLVIEFFDYTLSTSKAVTKLSVKETGETYPIAFNNLLAIDNPSRFITSEAKIKIPLKIDLDTVKYEFKLNTGGDLLENTDYLEFNYARNTVYVSRACGFKTLFSLNTNSPTKTDTTLPVNFWIRKITVTQPNILNENETHIKIYF